MHGVDASSYMTLYGAALTYTVPSASTAAPLAFSYSMSTLTKQAGVAPTFSTSPSHCWKYWPPLGCWRKFRLMRTRLGVGGLPKSTTVAPGTFDTNVGG